MSAVSYAAKHFCTDILGYELQSASSVGKGLYGASIPIFKGKDEYIFYLYFKEETLRHFSNSFFGSGDGDIDLADLSREVANQIIGYAKNLLNDGNSANYTLGTPEFLGAVDRFTLRLNESRVFKMKNRTFKIGYKKA